MSRISSTTDRREERATGLGAGGANRGLRAAGISLVALLALAAVACVWWFVVLRVADPSSTAASTQLTALDAKLTQVRDAIAPIAREFTTEPTSGPVDVKAYRTKIGEARDLVDGANGLEITDPDALEVRDLIVTGGSEVLAGMDAALDALVSDEASATGPAVIQVDAGLAKLEDARDLLDKLLGRSSGTQLVPDHPGDREPSA